MGVARTIPTMDGSVLPVSDSGTLIGRQEELNQFVGVLERRAPALVLVTGAAGVGKSRFLQEGVREALAYGWQVAYTGDADDTLTVDPRTREDSFHSTISGMLPHREDRIEIGASNAPARHPLVEHLRASAPVLVVIDGFRPGTPFLRWFGNQFLQEVRQTGTPIVVAVGERLGTDKALRDMADVVITLSPPAPEAIRVYLEGISRDITPPLLESELTEYVAAIREAPEKLVMLTRVLSIGRDTGS